MPKKKNSDKSEKDGAVKPPKKSGINPPREQPEYTKDDAASKPPEKNIEASEIEESEVDVAIDEFAAAMELEILYRGDNTTLHFSTFNINRPGLQLAGYYNHFSAERVQIFGEMETTYLQQMMHQARKTACETLMKQPIPCLILTSKATPCDELIYAAQKYNRVLLRSSLRSTMFVNKLSLYLNEILAPSKTIHGVLMDLYGVGVLVIGESGIGKSETALELIERGHRLVADDAVTIRRIGNRLDGTSPEVIRYFMEVRGIGIIDVKAMYGAGAVQLTKRIDMVVRLETWNDKAAYDRLGSEEQTYSLFGVKTPLYVIPVKPGRNLAVILEAAARTHRLNDLGFKAVDELNERLRSKINKD